MPIPRPVIVVSTAVAISLLGDSTLYAVLPSHGEQLGIRLALVGVLLSVNRFVRLLTNSVAGYVHDHVGRWWHFVVALAIGACTTAAYGLFWGFWAFLIARLAWGVCWSFLRLEGYATVMQHATVENRGALMGVYKSVSGTGFFAGSLLGGILTDLIGFRNCLLSFAALTLLGAVATFLNLSRNQAHRITVSGRVKEHERQKLTESHPPVDFQPSHSLTNADSNSKWRNHWPIYYIGYANVLVGSAAASTLGLLLKTRLGDVIQLGPASIKVASLTGILLAFRWAISFFFAPAFGHLADRLSRRFVLRFGLLIGIAGLALLATQDKFGWIGIALILTSISNPAILISLDASISDVASRGQRGKTIGVYTTFMDLGSAKGPLVSYKVIDWIGASLGLAAVYMAGVVLLLSAIIASFNVKKVQD